MLGLIESQKVSCPFLLLSYSTNKVDKGSYVVEFLLSLQQLSSSACASRSSEEISADMELLYLFCISKFVQIYFLFHEVVYIAMEIRCPFLNLRSVREFGGKRDGE